MALQRTALLLAPPLVALLSGFTAAAGPTFVVNNTADAPDALPGNGICETSTGNGICTLRAAIQEANLAGDALILLPATLPADPILLSGDQIPILNGMTIQGSGRTATIVSGKGTSRVFVTASGATASMTVTLRSMTIRDGLGTYGGGVGFADPTSPSACPDLVMENVLVTACNASRGAAVYSNAPVTLTNCIIDSCHADVNSSSGGGALWLGGSGSGLCSLNPVHVIQGSTLRNNTTAGAGGAVEVAAGDVQVVSTRVTANHATFLGGGIAVQGGQSLLIRDSTLDGNTAGDKGGGAALMAGETHIVNSTIYNNTAFTNGGGLSIYEQTVLENATVTENVCTTAAGGGGLYNNGGSATAIFANTVLANNYEPSGDFLLYRDCSGLLTSNGYNLMSDATHDCAIQGSGVAFADPKLGLLQGNGGPTPTSAPLSGSPAIDAGNPSGCAAQLVTLTADQRGVKRPLGAACDIGAYERSPCGDVNGDGAVNVSDVFFLINYLFAAGPLPPGLANVNADAGTNVSDVFYLINTLFAGGPSPNCPGT